MTVLVFTNEYASEDRVHVVNILLVQGASVPAARATPIPFLQLQVNLFSDANTIG